MRGWPLALALPLAVAVTARAASERAEPDSAYLGSEACGGCHAAELAAWRAGPHARASESLRGDERGDRRCQACHATGAAPAGRAVLPGVGCEACHGAGAAYAPEDVMRDPTLARALGLLALDTPARRGRVCGGCHVTRTRLAPFDAESAWRRIGHGGATGAVPGAPRRRTPRREVAGWHGLVRSRRRWHHAPR
jgi:hypothetical protein